MTVIRQGNYNTITLEQWYENPVHCPFCGTPSDPDSEPCKHLLYVILGGDFMVRADRVDLSLGLPPGLGACAPLFGLEDKRKHGKPLEAVARIAGNFPNFVEYRIVDPGDICYAGFARYEEEIRGWGS